MRIEPGCERFSALTGALLRFHGIWAPRPFVEQVLPWEAGLPALSAWLRGLDEAAVEALEGEVFAVEAPAPYGELARTCAALSRVEPLPAARALPPGDRRRVPDRKRRQVEALAAVARLGQATQIVDWCSGKGHLGRTLARATGLGLRLVERDAGLALQGEARARAEGVACAACVLDALGPEAAAALPEGGAAVALHACGALGDALLRLGEARGLRALSLAPCCYHRYQVEQIPLLSAAGRAAALPMPKDLGRMMVAEEVVARPKLRQIRRQEMAWRLGLDAALREASGEDRYTPLPPVTRTEAQQDFASFCRAMAEREGLRLPAALAPFEALGRTLARQTRALSLVRALFRRPLELWVVLDRALFLAERGWAVEVGTFCPGEITPRNLAILATRA